MICDKICDNIGQPSQAHFERLGGLPDAIISNSEWLYMLQEDTPNRSRPIARDRRAFRI